MWATVREREWDEDDVAAFIACRAGNGACTITVARANFTLLALCDSESSTEQRRNEVRKAFRANRRVSWQLSCSQAKAAGTN